MEGIDPVNLREALERDGEFRRASRQWSGSFAFGDEERFVRIELAGGEVSSIAVLPGRPEATVVFHGPRDGWRNVFAELPPPYYQDLVGGAVGRHGFTLTGDLSVMAAYYGAIKRAARVIATTAGAGVRA